MKGAKNSKAFNWAEEAARKIRVDKNLDLEDIDFDTPSFREKMKKGERILAKAGLPKEK